MATDGILYGVKRLMFDGKTLGYISEDGMTPGGDAPTKTRIYAAQKRDAPVKVLTSNSGTMTWSFVLIELDSENLSTVMGGTVGQKGEFIPSTDAKELEGVFDIFMESGEVIRLNNAVLSTQFTNNLNMNGVLGISCEIEVTKPADGGAAWVIYPNEAALPTA